MFRVTIISSLYLLPVMVWIQVPFTSEQPAGVGVAEHFGTSYSHGEPTSSCDPLP